MTAFGGLAAHYRAGRIGYSSDLYNALLGYGLKPKMRVVDVGCGTGLASLPLVENEYSVVGVDPSEPMLAIARQEAPQADFVVGSAEKLPINDGVADAIISAQVFHQVDREAALREVKRVLRPGGIVAIWWKSLVTGDAVKHVRDSVAEDFGATLAAGALTGGFKEFYGTTWSDTSLRVIPWRTAMPLSQYLEYERSRATVHERLGERAEQYIATVESRLRETFGENDPYVPLTYSQYLYLAKK